VGLCDEPWSVTEPRNKGRASQERCKGRRTARIVEENGRRGGRRGKREESADLFITVGRGLKLALG